jgi:hypothetical protein
MIIISEVKREAREVLAVKRRPRIRLYSPVFSRPIVGRPGEEYRRRRPKVTFIRTREER